MQRFKNFLYVMNNHIDKPTPSLLRTVSLAKSNQADLTLLMVIPRLALSSSVQKAGLNGAEIEKIAFEKEKQNLHQLIKLLDPEVNIKVEIKVGKRYLESIRSVLTQKFDMLIKEADKVSWFNRLITSDDMHLLRNCPCPVWLMKKDEKSTYKQVLAAVDFGSEEGDSSNDELNKMIVSLGSSISMAEFSTLNVVNAYDVLDAGFISLWVDDPDKIEKEMFEFEFRNSRYKMDKLLDDLKETIGSKAYSFLSIKSHIIKGVAGEELPKIAQNINADLVVMGTIARTGISGFVIGNTAETILNQLNSSILAIKPNGFVSPISCD